MTFPGLKVVHIIGCGRSGSTLLGDILGEHSGWFHAGELRGQDKALRSDAHVCSCGEPVRRCSFWGPILGSTAGDSPAAWRPPSLRTRHTLRILRASGPDDIASGEAANRLRAHLNLRARFYEAAARRAGAAVVVDSSKRPMHAALMGLLPDVDSFFVHIVRDPRGVAHSMATGLQGPEPSGPIASARAWVGANLAAARVRHENASRSILVRYEDFATSPRAAVSAILDLVGERPRTSPFLDDHTVRLEPRHTMKGNRSRLRTGPVEIRLEERWTHEMSRARAALVTTLTLPLLLRYGYSVRGHRPPGPSPPG